MSKIIKEGKLPVKRMTCNYCGCEFEYDVTDLDIDTIAFVQGFERYNLRCPHCGVTLTSPYNRDEMKAENPRKDFEEDVRSLASQYGLTVKSVEVE